MISALLLHMSEWSYSINYKVDRIGFTAVPFPSPLTQRTTERKAETGTQPEQVPWRQHT